MFGDNFVHNYTRYFRTLFVHFANCEMSILSNDTVHLLLQCVCDDRGSPWSLSVMNICSPIPKHCASFSDTGRVHNMFAIDCNKSSVNFTGSNVFRLQKPNHASHLSRGDLISARSLSQPVTHTTWKRSLHQLHQVTIYILLNTPHDWSGTMKQRRGFYAQTFFTFRTAPVILSWSTALAAIARDHRAVYSPVCMLQVFIFTQSNSMSIHLLLF